MSQQSQIPEKLEWVNKTAEGAEWAKWDPIVARRFGGKWVVAVPNEVIRAGDDSETVRNEAAVQLNMSPDDVVVCAVATPESRVWIGW